MYGVRCEEKIRFQSDTCDHKWFMQKYEYKIMIFIIIGYLKIVNDRYCTKLNYLWYYKLFEFMVKRL